MNFFLIGKRELEDMIKFLETGEGGDDGVAVDDLEDDDDEDFDEDEEAPRDEL